MNFAQIQAKKMIDMQEQAEAEQQATIDVPKPS